MTSSAKKKRDKKKDFQKPKYKVGKAQPKAVRVAATHILCLCELLSQTSLDGTGASPHAQYFLTLTEAKQEGDETERLNPGTLAAAGNARMFAVWEAIVSKPMGKSVAQNTRLPRGVSFCPRCNFLSKTFANPLTHRL